MTDQRPYAALLAKGEDRRQRILEVARRMFTRNGSRGTSLGQIAKEAGVTPAGILHHFDSKEQLLHAVLDARDSYDLAHSDLLGDIIEQLENVADRFEQAPELVSMFTVLLVENVEPDAPLHERFLLRYRAAKDIVAEGIRRGQRSGRYRTDLDPTAKAAEIIAFLYGIETSWLLDPSIPMVAVFREYTASLSRSLVVPPGGGRSATG